jgi:predicted oxidoreductase
VIVIGGGLAGLAAALELAVLGRSVVLLERGPEERVGGLATLSFGGLFFVDSPEQRRNGIHDSYELALDDWLRYGEHGAGDVWPRRWAEAFVARATPDVRDWLHGRGVRFFPALNWTERGYFVPGNSVPRFHLTWGTGPGIVEPLVSALGPHAAAGRVKLLFGHRVEALDVEAGRCTGCRGATVEGASFSARGDAVVLAAGGIAGDLERVRRHWPAHLGQPPDDLLNGSCPEADGRLLDEAARVGGRVTRLSNMWNYAAGVAHWQPLHERHGLSLVPGKSALWMNAQGVRFVDPPLVGSYDTLALVERICREPRQYSWQVLNYRIAVRELAVSGAEHNAALRDHKRLAFLKRILLGDRPLVDDFVAHCPDFVTADTVEALADKMNALAGTGEIDAGVLRREIERYDANVARPRSLQNDDQLRRIAQARRFRGDRLRTCRRARILDPRSRPLLAIRLRILTRKSLGGIVTDLQGRVLGEGDRPLPGLFAAGEAAGFGGGGIHGRRALEGTFLGGCIFSGRSAAHGIARGRALGENA